MKKCKYLLCLWIGIASADATEDLFYALAKQDLALVKQALKNGANVHARNLLDKTPLHEAAHSFSPAIQLLLGAGAKLEDGDEDDWTPLTFAALCNKNSVHLLLAAGAQVNHVDKDNMTPLDHAKDQETRALLRSHDALTAAELRERKKEE